MCPAGLAAISTGGTVAGGLTALAVGKPKHRCNQDDTDRCGTASDIIVPTPMQLTTMPTPTIIQP
jgi:hypothetical protein